MKKKRLSFLGAAALLLSVFLLTGCVGFKTVLPQTEYDAENIWPKDKFEIPPQPEEHKADEYTSGFNPAMFAGCSVNLDGVVLVGLAEGTNDGISANPTAASVSLGGMAAAVLSNVSAAANNRSFLFAFDEDGNPSIVQFVKRKSVGDTGEEIITQTEIDGEIDKLYVSGDFIFICYRNSYINWWNWERDTNPDYDRMGYECNWSVQSFVIYKPTGKVYALADIANNGGDDSKDGYYRYDYTFDVEDGNVISYWDYSRSQSYKKYIKLDVSGDNLTATELVPNTNIQVERILADKYGNTFVKINNGAATTVGATVFTRGDIYKGDDGLVYELSQTQPSKDNNWRRLYHVKFYNESRALTDLPADANVYLKGLNYWEGGWLINGAFMFNVSWNYMTVYYNAVNGYEDWCGMNAISNNNNTPSIMIAHGQLFAVVDDGNDNKVLKHFDLSGIEAPTVNYLYRNQGSWQYSDWVDGSYGEGSWDNQDRNGEEPAYVPSSYAYYFQDGVPYESGSQYGYLDYIYHPAGGYYVAKGGELRDGERVDQVYTGAHYVYEDGVIANWIGGEYTPGYYETETFIPYYSETDPEWNYYYLESGGELAFSKVTPVTEVTSAYVQGDELYAVVDSIFNREVNLVQWDAAAEKFVSVLSSSSTFTGTVITLRPLN
jgi:hypothetical protein